MMFYDSLFILTWSYDNITNLTEVIFDNDYSHVATVDELSEKDARHMISLYHQILLNTCTFLEEYDHNFLTLAESEYKEKVKVVMNIAKPVLKKIREWTGLRELRNEMLAHTWRKKKTKELSMVNIFKYDTPRTYWEIQILEKYLTMVVGLIEIEFSEELAQMSSYVLSLKQTPIPPKEHLNIFEEMDFLIKEVNTLCSCNNRPYRLDSKKIIGIDA